MTYQSGQNVRVEKKEDDSSRFAWIAAHEWNGRPPLGLKQLREVIDRAVFEERQKAAWRFMTDTEIDLKT